MPSSTRPPACLKTCSESLADLQAHPVDPCIPCSSHTPPARACARPLPGRPGWSSPRRCPCRRPGSRRPCPCPSGTRPRPSAAGRGHPSRMPAPPASAAPESSTVLTINEFAEYPRIVRSTLSTLVQQRRVPAQKGVPLGRFRKPALDRWLESGAGPATGRDRAK